MTYLMALTCSILLIQVSLCRAIEPALQQLSQQLESLSNAVPKRKGELTASELRPGLPTTSDVRPGKIGDNPNPIIPIFFEREDLIIRQIWAIKRSKDFKEVLNKKINQAFSVSNIDELTTLDNFSEISDAEAAPFNEWIEKLQESRSETNIQKAEEFMSRYNNELKFKNEILNKLADDTVNALKKVVRK